MEPHYATWYVSDLVLLMDNREGVISRLYTEGRVQYARVLLPDLTFVDAPTTSLTRIG